MTNRDKILREEFIARVNKKEEEMKRREEVVSLILFRSRQKIFCWVVFFFCCVDFLTFLDSKIFGNSLFLHITLTFNGVLCIFQLNLRNKEISDNFEEELRRIESQMHTLLEEKAKYEWKTAGKKTKK